MHRSEPVPVFQQAANGEAVNSPFGTFSFRYLDFDFPYLFPGASPWSSA